MPSFDTEKVKIRFNFQHDSTNVNFFIPAPFCSESTFGLNIINIFLIYIYLSHTEERFNLTSSQSRSKKTPN